MNNRDFDNLFNNKLDGIQESDFAFNDAAWDSVENRLDKKGILLPPQSRWRQFLPALLVLAFLGSNGLLSWKYYTADQKATLLTTERDALKSALDQVEGEILILNNERTPITAKTEEANTSNIPQSQEEQIQIIEKIVYVPKVVYVNIGDNPLMNNLTFDKSKLNYNSTILDESKRGKASKSTSGILGSNADLASKWGQSLDFKVSTDMNLGQRLSDNTIFNKNNNTTGSDSLNFIKEATETTDKIVNEFLENKPIKLVEYDLDSLANVKEADTKEYKNTLADYLFVIGEGLTPDGYELGIYGSEVLVYAPDYINHSRSGVGVIGGFSFSDNIRLSVGVNWNYTLYELEDIETGNYSDEFFASFPNMVPFYPDDQAHKLEGRLQSLEMPVELEYTFGSAQQSWRPFIGGGIIARYHYRQAFEYYFLQAPDYLFDYNTGYQNTTFRELGISTWTAKAGMEYNLNRHWLARGALTYANDFKANGFDQRAFQQFGARLSLMYRF